MGRSTGLLQVGVAKLGSADFKQTPGVLVLKEIGMFSLAYLTLLVLLFVLLHHMQLLRAQGTHRSRNACSKSLHSPYIRWQNGSSHIPSVRNVYVTI